jgi:SOS-response transcriptional repressor LexA
VFIRGFLERGSVKKVEVPNGAMLPEVRRLLAEGRTVTLRVRGDSMRPLLRSRRDKVTLAPCATLRRGDLALAEIGGRFVLHRVIDIRGSGGGAVVLMGDGNLCETESCGVADVAGVVVAIERNGRRFSCDSLIYRLYAWLWMRMKPLRRYLLR